MANVAPEPVVRQQSSPLEEARFEPSVPRLRWALLSRPPLDHLWGIRAPEQAPGCSKQPTFWSTRPTSSAGRHARSHGDLDPAQYTQGPERQPVGRDGRDADRAGACAHRVDRQGTFRICRTKRFGRSTWLPLCF